MRPVFKSTELLHLVYCTIRGIAAYPGCILIYLSVGNKFYLYGLVTRTTCLADQQNGINFSCFQGNTSICIDRSTITNGNRCSACINRDKPDTDLNDEVSFTTFDEPLAIVTRGLEGSAIALIYLT